MIRIFSTLAFLSLALLVAALALGLSIGGLDARSASQATLRWATWHRLTGLAAALGVVFVESIVVTYFIGTSRWCREVVETYHLNPTTIAKSNRLKRKAFPWALMGMLAVVVVIALGGAADTTITLQSDTNGWADWHLIAAFLGIAFVGWTYVMAWLNIMTISVIIEQTVREVARIRREKGLDSAPVLSHNSAEPVAASGSPS